MEWTKKAEAFSLLRHRDESSFVESVVSHTPKITAHHSKRLCILLLLYSPVKERLLGRGLPKKRPNSLLFLSIHLASRAESLYSKKNYMTTKNTVKKGSGKDVTVISLGGSMIVPDLPDPQFVKEFVNIITKRVKKGRRFVIVTGGGKTCRNYQNALSEVRKLSSDENDWMGIYTTHFNAHFMRLAFGKLAEKDIAVHFSKKLPFTKSVLVAAGELPGHSTDFDAVLLAKMFGSSHVVNISNIDFVYTADPRKNKNAKPLPRVSWKDYLALLPKKWTPGFSSPFDMKAAAIAKKAKLTVSIVNGNLLKEVEKALDQEEFRGSIIVG